MQQISRIPRSRTSETSVARIREKNSGQLDNLPASPWGAQPPSFLSMSNRAGLIQRRHRFSNNRAVSSFSGLPGIRRYPSDREILKRALAPPARRSRHRWLNFQPTPSRLSNMSMACEAS
ncbi:hypothetical protein NE237_001146 [Protea cynaroides]|uniref:Uncharacterized protein n=1 Tax=Protea cynaroides TaxID=273540 RepID=A0A9Q0KSS1_9MAGN|nr:hypothetical protein NE237_001146 [Protea cynaroides]